MNVKYVIFIVICSSPTTPSNGVMNCSVGNDIHYYQDTCDFICDTGYNLSGSSQRMCQSNGSWSNTDVSCKRGIDIHIIILLHRKSISHIFIVSCSSLTDPNYGMINCSLGDDGVPSYEDTCSFTCNTGYELTGSDIRTCQSDGSWSGSNGVCLRGI